MTPGAGFLRHLCLLWLVGMSTRITILAVPPVIPLIREDLRMSEAEVGLLVGLPVLTWALAAIPGSLLIARLGATFTLAAGLAVTGLAAGNLIDLVQEDDSTVLDAFNSQPRYLIHIDKLLLFFLNQVIDCLRNLHFSLLGSLAEKSREDIFDVDIHFFDALIGDDLEGWKVSFLHFNLDDPFVQLVIPQLLPEFLARP